MRTFQQLIIGKDARSEDLLELPDEEFIVPSNMKGTSSFVWRFEVVFLCK